MFFSEDGLVELNRKSSNLSTSQELVRNEAMVFRWLALSLVLLALGDELESLGNASNAIILQILNQSVLFKVRASVERR